MFRSKASALVSSQAPLFKINLRNCFYLQVEELVCSSSVALSSKCLPGLMRLDARFGRPWKVTPTPRSVSDWVNRCVSSELNS